VLSRALHLFSGASIIPDAVVVLLFSSETANTDSTLFSVTFPPLF
jgi:hypothetical protein